MFSFRTSGCLFIYSYGFQCGACPLQGINLINMGEGRKEGNVLFNYTLNTFYLRLYGVRHMVKDHTDSERGNPLPPHGLLFSISSMGYMHHPTDRIAHTSLCYSCGALARTRNSSMGPHHEGSTRRPIEPRANALTTELHLAPQQSEVRRLINAHTSKRIEISN